MKQTFQPQRTVRYYYLKFLRLKGDPVILARGIAIGMFIGITPTIPLHTILSIAIAFILRASKIAALLATIIVSNPLTFCLQYYLSWRIGHWLIRSDLTWETINTTLQAITADTGFIETLHIVMQLGFKAIATLIVGGSILAIPFALTGYLLSLQFFRAVQKKRQARQANALTS